MIKGFHAHPLQAGDHHFGLCPLQLLDLHADVADHPRRPFHAGGRADPLERRSGAQASSRRSWSSSLFIFLPAVVAGGSWPSNISSAGTLERPYPQSRPGLGSVATSGPAPGHGEKKL